MEKVRNNNKGQALIEFVLIIPIFVILLMGIIDLVNIASKKYLLENTLDTIVDLYETGDTSKMLAYANLENVHLEIFLAGEDLINISVSAAIDVATPGLNTILGDNYNISVDRTIYRVESNEE